MTAHTQLLVYNSENRFVGFFYQFTCRVERVKGLKDKTEFWDRLISNDQPSRLHRGRGFARARQTDPVAVQPTQAPEAALPPPPPVFTPEPTGELVTGVECPEPEGLQVFQIENSTTTKSLAGLPKPRLLPPVLQVRQWHSHP